MAVAKSEQHGGKTGSGSASSHAAPPAGGGITHVDYTKCIWYEDLSTTLEQLSLDREALKMLNRLYMAEDEQKTEFLAFTAELKKKAADGSLRKPSNFVVTCVQNALDKLEL